MADIRDSMVLAMTFSPLKTVVSLRHWPLGHVFWSSSASSLNSVGGSFHLGLLVPTLFVSTWSGGGGCVYRFLQTNMRLLY